MKLAIMQPYFFPYIGYFQCIKEVDQYILYNNLNYIKEGWMNRNRIMVKNREPSYITVPLEKGSSNKMIYEVEIYQKENWRKKMLNGIFLNYKKAQFFDEVFPFVSDIINYETNLLYNLNEYCVKQVSNFLEINTIVLNVDKEFTELEKKLNSEDAELKIIFAHWKMNTYDRKVIRVYEICKAMGAEVFLNAIGGQALYSKEEFKRNNLDLYFVTQNPDICYTQLSDTFYPGLSIIDVMMNCGKDGTKELLKKHTLI